MFAPMLFVCHILKGEKRFLTGKYITFMLASGDEF